MKFKLFKGKLKQSSNNILDIRSDDGKKRSVFNTELFLTQMSNIDVKKIKNNKSLSLNFKKLQLSMINEFTTNQETSEQEKNLLSSPFVQGYAKVNDSVYYLFGQKTLDGNYSLFGINKDEAYISFVVTDTMAENNLKHNNTLLSVMHLYLSELVDIDCGFGHLAEQSEKEIVDFGKFYANNFEKFNFYVDYDMFKQFVEYFEDKELVNQRIEDIQESLEEGLYVSYQFERKFDPLPYIKKIDKILREARLEKFGVENYSDLTDLQKENFGNEYDNFFEEQCKILIKLEIEEISQTNKMNDDTKEMLGNAFYAILSYAYYNSKDISIAYLSSFYSFDGYVDYACKDMAKICNQSPNKRFINVLLEKLDGNEMYTKDVLDVFLDANQLIFLDSTVKNLSLDEQAYAEIMEEDEEDNVYNESLNFISDVLTSMGFRNDEVANLFGLYSVFLQMQINFWEECEDNLSSVEISEKSYNYYEKLHAGLIKEYGKRIECLNKEEKKKFLDKNESFLDIKVCNEKGKMKSIKKTKQIPKINDKRSLEA